MVLIDTTLLRNGMADFAVRTLRGLSARKTVDAVGSREEGPAAPDALEDIAPSESWYKPKALCASERRELDTMTMIRGALYTKD